MDVHQGNNKPDLLIEIEDLDKEADFNDVVVWRAIAVRPSGTVVVNDSDPEIELISPWKARVRHTWSSVETAVVGQLYSRVEVEWPGGAKQTFQPNDNRVDVLP